MLDDRDYSLTRGIRGVRDCIVELSCIAVSVDDPILYAKRIEDPLRAVLVRQDKFTVFIGEFVRTSFRRDEFSVLDDHGGIGDGDAISTTSHTQGQFAVGVVVDSVEAKASPLHTIDFWAFGAIR